MARISDLRAKFHEEVGSSLVRWTTKGAERYPNFADGSSKSSIALATCLCNLLGYGGCKEKLRGQTVGRRFEEITCRFVKDAFQALQHLRPGKWIYHVEQTRLWDYAQYRHLQRLKELVERDPELKIAVGLDYLITPDIVIGRQPATDEEINQAGEFVKKRNVSEAGLTPFRAVNQDPDRRPILHAVISCKWTIRSDRSQNIRTEALNLIRNRKGRVPHIVAVTGEPLPTRLASLALGTGDLDCVYHIALSELRQACREKKLEDQREVLENLVDGDRLRDITDLPIDLAT